MLRVSLLTFAVRMSTWPEAIRDPTSASAVMSTQGLAAMIRHAASPLKEPGLSFLSKAPPPSVDGLFCAAPRVIQDYSVLGETIVSFDSVRLIIHLI